MKTEIRRIFTNELLFEYESDNKTLEQALNEAHKLGVDLSGAVLIDKCLNYVTLQNVDLSISNLYGSNLRNADLTYVNLHKAELKHVNLCGSHLCNSDLSVANLYSANLNSADLRGANLCGADLRCANLCFADLRGANLCGADLRYTNLCFVDLNGADLNGVDLFGANLYGAELRCVKNMPPLPLACPTDGSFVGWKKVTLYEEKYSGEFLVKLLIPEDARRSSATGNKCRCDKAMVLEIENLRGEKVKSITNINVARCVYKVGEMVYSDTFDEDRWNECSHGIHFFINKNDAINY